MSENFNFIAFGNWEYVNDATNAFEISRGRMFEYTPTDLAKRLEDLAPPSIEFIEKLPTFLCSEVVRSAGRASMLVKYVRIETIEPGRKEVSATFTTLVDFGTVEFTALDHALEVFQADGFQLYRTHWSIREGDAREVLRRLVNINLNLTDEVAKYLGREVAAEPPPREKKIIGEAESVGAYLQLLYGVSAKGATENFFRGHADARYELTPSLLRRWPRGEWKFMPDEERLNKELLIAHYDEFQGDQYCFDRLVRMQHYGLPTRLMDISGNPLIALFFACFGATTTDGEVIIFTVLIPCLGDRDSG